MVNHLNEHQTKSVDNSYAARLERLRDELNRPTVTEIIRRQKVEEDKLTARNQNDGIIELAPFHSVNTTTETFEGER